VQQIRVGWKHGIHAVKEPGLAPSDGGPWLPDTTEHREDVLDMIRSGNEICGEGCHWMEERTLVDAADPFDPRNRPPGPPPGRTQPRISPVQ
jgi:hypothetical protein